MKIFDARPNLGYTTDEPSLRTLIHMYYAQHIPDQADDLTEQYFARLETPRGMETAPTDGTMVRLAVDYLDGEGNLDDDRFSWTIGFNNLANDGEDKWQMAGWDWCQDEFTKGCGKPIGWLPWENPEINHES